MKKRLYLGLLAVAAIAAMTAAGSLALFTAEWTDTNQTFTAGTVSLTATLDRDWTISNIAPGDNSATDGNTTTLNVKYTGSLAAWLWMDTTLTGNLLTCSGGGHFDLDIKDHDTPANTYLPNATHQVLKDSTGNQTEMATNAERNFDIDYSLAAAAGNDCQGDTATFSLKITAVQAKNNTQGADPNRGPISWTETP